MPRRRSPIVPALVTGERTAAGGAVPAHTGGDFDRRWATIALMLATALQAADATIVNVALPQMEHDLGGGVALGAWVMTSYLCAAAVVAPLTGWLRRRFGAGRLYAGAMLLFLGASLLCATAHSALSIILFRTLQGAGGGVIPALSQAVLHDLHPRERHGPVLAMWGAVAMLGPIFGPALGGIITDLGSWRWVFLINLPLGAVAICGMRRVPREEHAAPASLDMLGILLMVAGISSLQLMLHRGVGRTWWGSPELLIEAVIAVAAAIAMVRRTRRYGPTILWLGVFRDINFAAAAFFNFIVSALLFTSIVFIPSLVQGPLGYSATIAGLTIVPRGILMMAVILLSGRLIGKIDFRIAMAVGCLCVTAGLMLLGNVHRAGDLGWVIFGSSVLAMGAGTVLMPLSTYAFTTLQSGLRTDAAGLYSLLRQIGCAAGVAVMTGILQLKISGSLGQTAIHHLSNHGALASHDASRQLQAYAECFHMMAICGALSIPGLLLFRPAPYGREAATREAP
jgi:DHA2 family multidrug resistance protein